MDLCKVEPIWGARVTHWVPFALIQQPGFEESARSIKVFYLLDICMYLYFGVTTTKA